MSSLPARQPVEAEGPVRRSRWWELPLWQPLRLRDFRLLWLGENISVLGDQFYFVALAWLTLQLTGSALALGTVFMTAAIPRGVLMLLGGAITDRLSPRLLMLVSNVSRAVVVGGLTALVLLGDARLWQLYVVALVFGALDSVFYPAYAAIAPMLLEEDQLTAGNGLLQGAQELMGFVGPALAGIVIAVFSRRTGSGIAFGLDAASFAIAALALFLMRGGSRSVQAQPAEELDQSAAVGGEGLLQSIGGGLRYVWNDPVLRVLVVVATIMGLAAEGPIVVGLADLAHSRFSQGSVALGIMFSAWGAGAIIGTIVAGSIRRPRRKGALMTAVTFLFGVGFLLVGISHSLGLTVAVLAIVAVGNGVVNIVLVSWLQVRTAGEMMGRVMSLVMLASTGLAPVSLAVAGFLADVNVTLLFAVAAALTFTGTLTCLTSRTVRTFD